MHCLPRRPVPDFSWPDLVRCMPSRYRVGRFGRSHMCSVHSGNVYGGVRCDVLGLSHGSVPNYCVRHGVRELRSR